MYLSRASHGGLSEGRSDPPASVRTKYLISVRKYCRYSQVVLRVLVQSLLTVWVAYLASYLAHQSNQLFGKRSKKLQSDKESSRCVVEVKQR